MEFLRTVRNPHTLKEYCTALDQFRTYCSKRSIPTEPSSAVAWLQRWPNLGTRNVKISALRSYWKYRGRSESEMRMTVPFEPYRAPRQPVVPWSSKDRILLSAPEGRDQVFLSVLFYSGLRWEGMRNLKWWNVHREERELETTEKRGIPRTRDSKLGPVHVASKVMELLCEWRESLDPRPEDSEAVFPFTDKTARAILHRAMLQSGTLPKRQRGKRLPGMHAVRRGFASRQLEVLKAKDAMTALRALDIVRRSLSHLNPSTTTQYLYLDSEDSAKAYDEAFED